MGNSSVASCDALQESIHGGLRRQTSHDSESSDSSCSSTASKSSNQPPLEQFCGMVAPQDINKRFHWVPPKGWDTHARHLGISARNNLSWAGKAPVPRAPAGGSWILPVSDKLSLRIAKLRDQLLEAGWKVITSQPEVIERLGNKALLPEYARQIGMTAYLPEHFASPTTARYPCVLKPAKGEYGKKCFICQSVQDVVKRAPEGLASKYILQELVPGHVEYAVSLLVSYGKILGVVGTEYTYDREVYIWPNVEELGRVPFEVPGDQVTVMERFLDQYDGILNFNYKVRADGRLCIFEVNTRIGSDLGCDAPRETVRQLFEMLDSLRG